MNILPKNYGEFQSKIYWDKFFRKLKKKHDAGEFFEWYGSFKDYEGVLRASVDPSQTILNIGCGNSLFSEEMYDAGYKQFSNCDFSEQVVKDMMGRSVFLRPGMKYEVMDIFNLTYPPQSFDVVVDKGTMDAVYPEDTDENTKKINELLGKLNLILTDTLNSRYIMISLLQSHILNTIVNHFYNLPFEINIYEILIDKSTLFPFILDIKRSNKNNNKITLHLKSDPNPLLLTPQELKQHINRIQTQNRFMSQVKKLHAQQRFSIEVWDSKNPSAKVPKYTLHVVDSPNKKLLENVRYPFLNKKKLF